MISLETARKLKEAGLRWEPQIGDCFYDNSLSYTKELKHVRKYELEYKLIYTLEYFEEYLMRDKKGFRLDKLSLRDGVFAPRLDQLLAEIEKRGYRWDIGDLGYLRDDDVCIGLFNEETREYVAQFFGVIPEEVAALALIWILEREKVAE